jgi:tRNA-uridine 2-sulfurtransferase
VVGWNWHFPPGDRPEEAFVQVRYRQKARLARLVGGPEMLVEWKGAPQCATPGQAAVAYLGDTVVGGGWIARRRE